MGFTFVDWAWGWTDSSGTTQEADNNASERLNVAAGDLIVALVYSDTEASISVTDGGSNTLTMLPETAYGGVHSACGYKLSASANSSALFTCTWSGSVSYKTLRILQFRPDSGETVSLIDENSAGGSANPAVSGSIDTTGNDIALVGLFGHYDRTDFGTTTALLGGATATKLDITHYSLGSYYLTSSGASGVTASFSNASGNYTCHVVGFASAAGGGAGNPWYYYAQQLRSLKDKWRGLLTIPSLEEVKLYGGRTRYA